MTRLTVHEYAAGLRPRYQTATKGVKRRILDEFCETTGMHRKAAIRLLGRVARPSPLRRGRPRRYGPEVTKALVKLWEVGDRMCGKLLAAVMPDLLGALERHGELKVSPEVRELLLAVSASTIDRLLRRQRLPRLRQPRRQIPSTTTLKSQIPIRTWSEWKGSRPGSMQADLVLHCGESTEGFYLTTLCAVDVATSWTELRPVWGMGQQRVGGAMHDIHRRLPFPLRALHTDNGSEFINRTLYSWCRRHGVQFTRGRGYHKNDQAYVEERNWLSVRRQIGYDRYSSQKAFELLHQLYPLLNVYNNFFRPVRKLVAKERLGSKVVKRYDEPRTPYQRLLAAGVLSAPDRVALEKRLLALNPAQLQRRIDQLLRQLWQSAERPTARAAKSVG
ncbi:MAG: integrase catalytic domain-containing protein [Dehalococcoidia bacterium]